MRLEDDREFVRWPQNVPCRQRMPAQERAGEEEGGWCCTVWAAVMGQGQGDDSGDC